MSKKKDYRYKVTIKMTEETMSDYMLYRVKTNAGTIFPYLFVILFVYQLIDTWGEVSIVQSLLYIIFSVLFSIGVPLNARMQAKKAFKPGSNMSAPIDYYFTEDGILQEDDEENIMPWEGIYRIDTTKLNVIICATKKLALFFPKADFENYEEVRDFMLSKLGPKQARMDNLYGTYIPPVEENEEDK